MATVLGAHNSSAGSPKALSKERNNKLRGDPFRAQMVFFLVKVKMIEDSAASLGNQVQRRANGSVQIGFVPAFQRHQVFGDKATTAF